MAAISVTLAAGALPAAGNALAQTPPPAAASHNVVVRTITGGTFAINSADRTKLFLDVGESPRAASAARAALEREGFAFVDRKEDALYVVAVRAAIGFADKRRFYFLPVETYFDSASGLQADKAGMSPRTVLSAGGPPLGATGAAAALGANILLNIAQAASAPNPNPSADLDQQQAYRHAGSIGASAVVHLNVRPVQDAQRRLPSGFVRGQAVVQGASLDEVDPTIDFVALIERAATVAAQGLAGAPS